MGNINIYIGGQDLILHTVSSGIFDASLNIMNRFPDVLELGYYVDNSKNPPDNWGIKEDSFVIESIIGQVLDTCEFTVYDKYSTLKNYPIVFHTLADIAITRNNSDEIIFSGLIAHIAGEPEGFSTYWHISCQDYTLMLDRTLVIQDYPANYIYAPTEGDYMGTSLSGIQAIIAAAFEKDIIGQFGVSDSSEIEARTFVEQGLPSLSQQVFRYSTLRETVSQLAQYVGYDFYVDYYKRLHFFYREDFDAAYDLTDNIMDSDNEVNYRDLTWTRDGTRVVNTFALFGDRLLSDNQTSLLSASGVQTEFALNIDTIRLNYPIVAEPGQRTVRIDVRRVTGVNDDPDDVRLTANIHNGGDNMSVLSVSSATFVTDGVEVENIIINNIDGSWGVITGVTETTINAILRGGTRNNWDDGDEMSIPQWDVQSVTSDLLAEDEDFDVRHESLGRLLRFQVAPPQDDYAIRLRYAYTFVAGQVNSDSDSINRYGRVFSRRVVASDVNSAQGMVQKLGYLQEQYADALEVATLKISDDMFPTAQDLAGVGSVPNSMNEEDAARRFEAGQWVTIKSKILPLDKEMLIHRITTRILGVGEDSDIFDPAVQSVLEYEIELRDWEVDII